MSTLDHKSEFQSPAANRLVDELAADRAADRATNDAHDAKVMAEKPKVFRVVHACAERERMAEKYPRLTTVVVACSLVSAIEAAAALIRRTTISYRPVLVQEITGNYFTMGKEFQLDRVPE